MVKATQDTAAKDSNGAAPPVMTSSRDSGHKGDAASKTSASKDIDKNADAASKSQSPAKKRRKVNHACIYCRRSHMTCDLERPCTRCIKRNIGHLCHDEPREPAKRQKTEPPGGTPGDAEASKKLDPATTPDATLRPLDQRNNSQDAGLTLQPPPMPQGISNSASIAQPAPVSAPQASNLAGNSQSFLNYNDWNFGAQNNFQDMHAFHPSYMFNSSEASNEYNLLNDFLSTSFLDDSGMYAGEDTQQGQVLPNQSLTSTMSMLSGPDSMPPPNQPSSQPQPPAQTKAGSQISRPPSSFPLDKAREVYYMTAADPAGTDTPEERMNKLLKAKFDAGLLKPFNYIKGYARLYQYMERKFHPTSRQKILRCMDRFRPKFRERVQTLTDIELVRVEMWFERCLMEYDRVFASMAIPACCWRRTGEIFRANNEMAELVKVPTENLRDGKTSLHEIVEEKSLVSYWEKFGAIAFDSSQKAILTSCLLKNPDSESKEPEIRCCFSFTIRRDAYDIPSLIIGNFLPIITDNDDP
ncbi:Zn cluster transcription factor Rds2 [Phyllosticta paracitricarpa]|uniref:Zn cluster transcription factor Rds2 n=2 Tax=Phyllosticta TaxID=121621 RepID=A0ABR1LMG5_9PEZI